VAYIEGKDSSILNAGRYTLDDGSPAFDVAVIFAANIIYDGEKAYLHFNENVQQVLDNAETTIRPLQRRGIKVTLSILGNHQGAGFASVTLIPLLCRDRKSTRLNSSHVSISYAVFCLKKKK